MHSDARHSHSVGETANVAVPLMIVFDAGLPANLDHGDGRHNTYKQHEEDEAEKYPRCDRQKDARSPESFMPRSNSPNYNKCEENENYYEHEHSLSFAVPIRCPGPRSHNKKPRVRRRAKLVRGISASQSFLAT